MLKIEKKILERIFSECRKRYPEEACGLVLGNDGCAVEAYACKNIQNELHRQDPKRYPRDAGVAYTIDPKEAEKIRLAADEKNLDVLAIFHSHPEHGVYFSEEDKNMAAPWGNPLFPRLSYIVVSVYGEEIRNVSGFCWDSAKKDFVEQKII